MDKLIDGFQSTIEKNGSITLAPIFLSEIFHQKQSHLFTCFRVPVTMILLAS